MLSIHTDHTVSQFPVHGDFALHDLFGGIIDLLYRPFHSNLAEVLTVDSKRKVISIALPKVRSAAMEHCA